MTILHIFLGVLFFAGWPVSAILLIAGGTTRQEDQ